jgi:hypothetical protein
MHRTLALLCCAVALLAACQPAWAVRWGKIKVTCDVPAQVSMDGVVMGYTPLKIHKVRDGDHFIRVQALDSGKIQVINLNVPAVPFFTKEVNVYLGPGRSYVHW